MKRKQLQKTLTMIMDMNGWEPAATTITLSATGGAEAVSTIPGLIVSSVDVETMRDCAAASGLVIPYWAVEGAYLTVCFDKGE